VKGADGVFRCPSQPRERPYRPDGRDPLQPGPPGPLRSVDYLYNGPRLNGWNPQAAGNPWKAKHESVHEIASLDPAAVWLHRDKGWVDEAGSYHLLRRVAAPSCGRPFTGGTLHSGGSNYSFVDGQVRWLTPEQMAEVECRNPPLPPPFTQAYE